MHSPVQQRNMNIYYLHTFLMRIITIIMQSISVLLLIEILTTWMNQILVIIKSIIFIVYFSPKQSENNNSNYKPCTNMKTKKQLWIMLKKFHFNRKHTVTWRCRWSVAVIDRTSCQEGGNHEKDNQPALVPEGRLTGSLRKSWLRS